MKKLLISTLFILSFILLGCSSKSNILQVNYMSGSYLEQYHILDLRGKGLTKIPNICKDYTGIILMNVWSIDLGDNKISTIDKDLSCLAYLQEINLSYNNISQINNLDKIKNLSKLELHKNKLKNTNGLEKLSTLKTLNLGYNQISDISALKNLKNLTTLELQQNQISDISPLSALINLETLKLEFNKISDESQLKIFEYLKNLKRISLGMNQLPQDKVKALQDKINPAQQ